jgi:exonuclease SbcC
MAEGVRDAGRYLHQVLGMDDGAFRASVFAEQKQLAAFSDRTPAERRQLVLQLLGITPLDTARDAARKDAREARQSHERLRAMLPDLDQLRVQAADAVAKAEAAVVTAETEEAAAGAARRRALAAEEAFGRLDRLRQEFDALVTEGRSARLQLDEAVASVAVLEAEQAGLASAEAELASLLPRSSGVTEAEARLERLSAVVAAERALAAIAVPKAAPQPADADAVADAEAALEAARAAAADVAGQVNAIEVELERARTQLHRSAELSGGADCPLCGQALGDAFEKVQAHRAAEVADAEARRASLSAHRVVVDAALASARAAFAAVREEEAGRLKAFQVWEKAQARRADADEVLQRAQSALGDISEAGWVIELLAGAALPSVPASAALELVGGRRTSFAELQAASRRDVDLRRSAAAAVARLQGRLERRDAVAAQLSRARLKATEAEQRVTVLLDKARSLGFDKPALAAAATALADAAAADTRASRLATDARVAAERAGANAEGESRRLADGEAQHAQLAALADDSRHLGRLSDLLNAFRNTIVATVGPRLAVQAAELFSELTDREYDELRVDPLTYELQICDGGRVFGLDRFSGSEVDLANLALRVAISEHVRFQSGGTVGLLVLDEVFGPLDQDRKARMLQALERLRGRFRQILVVTHDSDIKEQLPHAIEVIKLPGRRATARLLDA